MTAYLLLGCMHIWWMRAGLWLCKIDNLCFFFKYLVSISQTFLHFSAGDPTLTGAMFSDLILVLLLRLQKPSNSRLAHYFFMFLYTRRLNSCCISQWYWWLRGVSPAERFNDNIEFSVTLLNVSLLCSNLQRKIQQCGNFEHNLRSQRELLHYAPKVHLWFQYLKKLKVKSSCPNCFHQSPSVLHFFLHCEQLL